jgi:2-keto-4-pentenoate hydratase/2-oxohepta-3-ene-1,7-dioic acid hydratase in catechol pathway
VQLIGRAHIDGKWSHGEIIGDTFRPLAGDLFEDRRHVGSEVPVPGLVLGVPLEGVRFINVMGGFRMPDRPQARDLPPMWLPKAPNFPSGDGAGIQIPSVLTGPVQIESELAVVVGKRLRKASPEEALASIFGWTVFNDITAPEYGDMGFWAVGKSIDGFASWGPWIRLDLTEARVMDGLAITALVNGKQAQAGNTREFKFRPSEMLSHISHRVTLFPGDVVALGTPYPAAEVKIGDEAVCEVEEIGRLRNSFVPETLEPPSLGPYGQMEELTRRG